MQEDFAEALVFVEYLAEGVGEQGGGRRLTRGIRHRKRPSEQALLIYLLHVGKLRRDGRAEERALSRAAPAWPRGISTAAASGVERMTAP